MSKIFKWVTNQIDNPEEKQTIDELQIWYNNLGDDVKENVRKLISLYEEDSVYERTRNKWGDLEPNNLKADILLTEVELWGYKDLDEYISVVFCSGEDKKIQLDNRRRLDNSIQKIDTMVYFEKHSQENEVNV